MDKMNMPYQITDYLQRYNIESHLNESLNEALKTFPADLFSFLCGKFKEVSNFDT